MKIDIRRFLRSTKPAWCKPVDILLIAIIIDKSDDEGKCWASQSVLGALIGLDRSNVRAPLDRLIEHGWLTEIKRSGSYQSNILFPQLHNIPFESTPTPMLTADSRRLAARYYETVKALPKVMSRNGRMRAAAYPHKGWSQHWALVMQGWLDAGNTVEQIQQVVDYAFQHEGDTAKRGPQCVKPHFNRLAEAVRTLYA